MQYTHKSFVLSKFLKHYVPEESTADIYLYIQDVTTDIDFYVIEYDSQYGDMVALVDPIPDPMILDLELVNVDSLDGHRLFIKVFKKNSPLKLEEVQNRILPLKYMIPARK